MLCLFVYSSILLLQAHKAQFLYFLTTGPQLPYTSTIHFLSQHHAFRLKGDLDEPNYEQS